MEQHTILAPSDVVTEVERYCVLPGQACSYKVGQLSILKLRAELQAELGAAFDVRAFHRCLLEGGGIPVAMLPQVTAGLLAAADGEAAGEKPAKLPRVSTDCGPLPGTL